MNPKDFTRGEYIRDIYLNKVYEVIEPDKKGMAKLRNIESGGVEDWNAYNNDMFIKYCGQLKMNLVK